MDWQKIFIYIGLNLLVFFWLVCISDIWEKGEIAYFDQHPEINSYVNEGLISFHKCVKALIQKKKRNK
jgi:hypothetical protein